MDDLECNDHGKVLRATVYVSDYRDGAKVQKGIPWQILMLIRLKIHLSRRG